MMGVISSEKCKLYHGRGAGKALDNALSSAEDRIWVASSKIDERNIRKLVKRKRQDSLDVKILVEKDNKGNKLLKSLLDIEEAKEHTSLYDYRFVFLAATIISILGVGLSFSFNEEMVYIPLTIAVISVGLLFSSYFFTINTSKVRSYEDLFIQDTNNHITNSRIYILDDKVFVGSVDLTDEGLWKDREVLFELQSGEAKESIEMMFISIVNEIREMEKV